MISLPNPFAGVIYAGPAIVRQVRQNSGFQPFTVRSRCGKLCQSLTGTAVSPADVRHVRQNRANLPLAWALLRAGVMRGKVHTLFEEGGCVRCACTYVGARARAYAQPTALLGHGSC